MRKTLIDSQFAYGMMHWQICGTMQSHFFENSGYSQGRNQKFLFIRGGVFSPVLSIPFLTLLVVCLFGVWSSASFRTSAAAAPSVDIAELEQLILRHGPHIHQYADDSQVYISVAVNDARVAVHSFAASAGPEVFARLASRWNSLLMMMMMSTSMTSMSGWESQQTAAERDQDAGHCGSAPDCSWSMLTSTTSRCCRPPSWSSRARATSELLSTAGWHYRRTSQRWGRVLPTPVNTSTRPIDDGGSCKNRSCGVFILSVGLL